METFREGAVGALMDEYENAVFKLIAQLNGISKTEFVEIVDTTTKDDDCRSIQTIMNHVVRAGFGYANYFREQFDKPIEKPEIKIERTKDAIEGLNALVKYTIKTLEGKWQMTEQEAAATKIETTWKQSYDFEQLFEHAIVHILRHHRQIRKFLVKLR